MDSELLPLVEAKPVQAQHHGRAAGILQLEACSDLQPKTQKIKRHRR